MTVTISQPQATGRNTFIVSWSSNLSDPTFYVYQDGKLISVTKQTQMSFSVQHGESLVVEVLDDASAKPVTAFPGRLTLNWYASADTDYYRIEEYVNSSWTLKASIDDSGQGYFTYRTRFLEDQTTHQFRIIPVGKNGNQGTAKNFSCLMVRHPNPPDVNFSYSNDDETVTISAA